MDWQIQEAKARFSEMVERTLKKGPQTVTRHGKPVAVLVPVDEYRRLRTGGKKLQDPAGLGATGRCRDPAVA
jgi:prevent-host-death family protein